MKTEATETTRVIFRKWRGEAGGIIALFPRIPASAGFPWEMLSYEHIGQHGAADVGIIGRTRPAKPAEYADLKAELERIGYRLEVRQRFTQADHIARHEALRAPR